MRVIKTGENIVLEEDCDGTADDDSGDDFFLRRDRVGSRHSEVACRESGP